MRRQGAELIPCEGLDFIEASFCRRVYPLMYCHMELSGRPDVERLKRAVSLSGEIVPELLCAYDFKRDGFVKRGYTADDVVKDMAALPGNASLLRPDLSRGPQLRIFIAPKGEGALALAVMSHILSDGEGFLQYLYLLASLYSGRRPDEGLRNLRAVSPLLAGIRVLEPTEQTRYNRLAPVPPLRPGNGGSTLFCLTARLSSGDMEAVRRRAGRSNASMNDVFMAAYARVVARLQRRSTAVLPCPADLRRFHPDGNVLTVANMTGIYRKITVEIPPDSPFTETLQQVHIEMELQKSRCRCFAGIRALDQAFRRVPHGLLRRAVKAVYRLQPVSYTNFGVIRHEKLCFGNCAVKSCFLTGTYRQPPDFQLTVSTFKEECTLNCTLIGSEGDKRRGQYILEQVRKEILEWSRTDELLRRRSL